MLEDSKLELSFKKNSHLVLYKLLDFLKLKVTQNLIIFFKGLFGGKESEATNLTDDQFMASQGFQTGGLAPPGQMSVVGEAGAELIMSKSPVQVFNESRTDALGAAALNSLMTGGGMGSGGNIIAPVNQVQNNTHQSVVRPISNQDPIIDKMTSSLAI